MKFLSILRVPRRRLVGGGLLWGAVAALTGCRDEEYVAPPRRAHERWVFLAAVLTPLPAAQASAKARDTGGSAQVSIDLEPLRLEWEVYFSNLSGPVTALGFYGAELAAAGVDGKPQAKPSRQSIKPPQPSLKTSAEVVIDLSTVVTYSQELPLRYQAKGRAPLTPDQAAELEAGRWWLVVSTAAFPQGELAGVVRIKPPGVGGV